VLTVECRLSRKEKQRCERRLPAGLKRLTGESADSLVADSGVAYARQTGGHPAVELPSRKKPHQHPVWHLCSARVPPNPLHSNPLDARKTTFAVCDPDQPVSRPQILTPYSGNVPSALGFPALPAGLGASRLPSPFACPRQREASAWRGHSVSAAPAALRAGTEPE